MAFDSNQPPPTTVFHINDVGQNTWEEIDLGASAKDYGWNVCEGFHKNGSSTLDCTLATATDPLLEYPHDGCNSITGGAFVPTSAGWPAPYGGSYLFSDYVCGMIWRLVPPVGGGQYTRSVFASGLGGSSAVHLTFGPTATGQALYYTTYASGGQVRRIRYSPSNMAPTAVLTANPTSGLAALVVTFDGSGSSDPEGGPLSYQWTFGDGQSQTTSGSSIEHTYGANGTYTASLVVVDNQGAPSPADTVTIQVGGTNTPPSPTITTPSAGTLFAVGQRITLTGSATDAQDGTIPATGLTWQVLRHHADHTHPWFGPTTGNNLSFLAPAPEDLAATTNSYLEVILTATDSGGLSSTVTRNVMPKTVSITFATSPSGLTVTVNGTTLVGPTTITSWQAYLLNVNAPDQTPWTWQSWSDGGARSHTIKTPASAATYTATFTQGGGCGPRGCV
jgi:PKD repeat protein